MLKFPHWVIFSLLLVTMSSADLLAQEKKSRRERWEPRIQAFEAQDEKSPPEKNGVLMIGSSSIVLWDTKKYFPDQNVINRGFGGSIIDDQLMFIDRTVWKYEPRIIVFYCGDNDLSSGQSVENVIANFEKFRLQVSEKLPETKLIFIPVKPSVRRWNLWDKMQQVNQIVEEKSKTEPNLYYCDVATPMLATGNPPSAEFFVKDGLHLSEAGYILWTKHLQEMINQIDEKN